MSELLLKEEHRISHFIRILTLCAVLILLLTACATAPTPGADNGAQDEFIQTEEIIIGLLFLAIIVGVATYRLRVPYTIGLVLMGLLLTLRGAIHVSFSPTIILALLVPPLVFEAAFHLNLKDLRTNLLPILVLAIPGVILTTIVSGGIVSWGIGLALPTALVFGAIVSATDPVSVVALFRKLGVPKRLRVLLEGESLFNDGTAIVVFQLVVAAALAGSTSFNLARGLTEFVLVSGGGLAIGLLLGFLASQLIQRIDDYLFETTLTLILAYGAYLVAEAFGTSGVLAVVAAGLVNGNIGPRGMSPTTRIVVFNFWELAAFLANTFIFLLIGLQIDLTVLFENWQAILWAIFAVLISRALSIYGLSRIEREIPLKWQHVLYWGGMRGAISLALALSLPASFGGTTQQLQAMTFGVVLFTLLGQGLTMKPLIRRLGVVEQKTILREEYERRNARAIASQAAYEHLQHRRQAGLLSEHTWQHLAPMLEERTKGLTGAAQDVLVIDPSVEAEELDAARNEYYRAQRSVISGLLKDSMISEEVHSQLISEIDAAIIQPHSQWSELLGSAQTQRKLVNRLMAAIVQEQDAESAMNALTKRGVIVTHLSSTGGFLRKRNVTMLIGLSEGQESAVVASLQLSCRKRVEYLSSLPVGMFTALSAPIPVTIGGATVFTFHVERFEVF